MATTPPLPHIPQGAAQVALPPNRLSEPTIYPKFATRLGSLNCLRPKYYHEKGRNSHFFLVEKPSNETTATTFNISGIQAQHDQVAMAMHGVTTETRYIHVHVLKKQNSNFMFMYISIGNT